MDFDNNTIFIFDVNGVLIDSNEANARAMAAVFTDDPQLQERISKYYLTLSGIDRGAKIRDIQEHLIGRPFTENEFELRWEGFKKLSKKTMLGAPLGQGAKEVLGKLRDAGCTLVALSNTPSDELGDILAGHGLDQYFDVIRGGGNWPKAESLLRLLEEFQFKPEDCFFLADGKGDLKAARAAGVPFGGIDPGTGEFDQESGIGGPYRNLAEWGRETGLLH
ncbi:MAG: HAD family hydrolase [Deltaproteobacteria bacterium]|nr:HAD family hydrolase [Deltaproteobacteria bacterium]